MKSELQESTGVDAQPVMPLIPFGDKLHSELLSKLCALPVVDLEKRVSSLALHLQTQIGTQTVIVVNVHEALKLDGKTITTPTLQGARLALRRCLRELQCSIFEASPRVSSFRVPFITNVTNVEAQGGSTLQVDGENVYVLSPIQLSPWTDLLYRCLREYLKLLSRNLPIIIGRSLLEAERFDENDEFFPIHGDGVIWTTQ